MGETIGFISHDHFLPFFLPAACGPPFPGADGHPSSCARLHSRIRASMMDPTPMVTAHRPYSTVAIISRSQVAPVYITNGHIFPPSRE